MNTGRTTPCGDSSVTQFCVKLQNISFDSSEPPANLNTKVGCPYTMFFVVLRVRQNSAPFSPTRRLVTGEADQPLNH